MVRPQFTKERYVGCRIEPEIFDQIETVTKKRSLKKSDWFRDLIYEELK